MENLKKLKINSGYEEFMNVYCHNMKIVGPMVVTRDVKTIFIKLLMLFPLKDKKLKYFLSLDPKTKVGYMSKYMMKIARQLEIPQEMIKQYYDAKVNFKFYQSFVDKIDKNSKNYEYLIEQLRYEIKRDVYKRILRDSTIALSSTIFHSFDNIRKLKLEKILN